MFLIIEIKKCTKGVTTLEPAFDKNDSKRRLNQLQIVD